MDLKEYQIKDWVRIKFQDLFMLALRVFTANVKAAGADIIVVRVQICRGDLAAAGNFTINN